MPVWILRFLKVCAGLGALFLFGKSKKSAVFGNARWMSPVAMGLFLNAKKNTGLVFGKRRMSEGYSFRNVCVVAPSGFGKSKGYVIPNVLECSGSFIVTDPSEQIYKATSGHLQSKGYTIQVLQPADVTHSQTFNPLDRFKTEPQLKQIAAVLGQNAGGDRSDPYWKVNATTAIYLCLCALTRAPEKYRNLANVRWLLNNLAGFKPESPIARFMYEHLDERMYVAFRSFVSRNSRLFSSIISSAETALDLWTDTRIEQLTVTTPNHIDLDSLRQRKTAVFVIVPEHEITYFSLLLNLFYSACFEYCLETGNDPDVLPVYFFLDEFGNLGKINNFASIITTLRKRKCSISMILQDVAQLESIYGKNDAQTIFSGGVSNRLFLPGLDIEMCRYIQSVLGNKTVTEKKEDGTIITVAKPLLTVDEVRMMPDSKAILISGNQKPIKLTMKNYDKHPRLRTYSQKPVVPYPVNTETGTVEYVSTEGNTAGITESTPPTLASELE